MRDTVNWTQGHSSKIVLIGMPGCGKTTLASLLAQWLGWPWFDSDQIIEERAGMTIEDIFSRHGEGGFREMETSCIRDLLRESGAAVISLGGGGVRNFIAAEEHGGKPLLASSLWRECFFVYVHRSVEDILASVELSDRPLLKNDPDRLYELFAERHPLYERVAHVCVHNKGDIAEVADKARKRILNEMGEERFGREDTRD